MYVIKGMRQCSCYELDDKEGRLLVDLELPGGKRQEIAIELEKVDFFIPTKALSG